MFSKFKFKFADKYMSDEGKIAILEAIMNDNVKLSSIKYFTFQGSGGSKPDNNFFVINRFIEYLKGNIEIEEEKKDTKANLILIKKELKIIDGKCKLKIIWNSLDKIGGE